MQKKYRYGKTKTANGDRLGGNPGKNFTLLSSRMALTWYSEVRKHPSNTHPAQRTGASWSYEQGDEFSTQEQPTALCRCGGSHHKPYCDGSHEKHDWEPQLTAAPEPILEGAKKYEGPRITLYDNEKILRFCSLLRRVRTHLEPGTRYGFSRSAKDNRARSAQLPCRTSGDT